MSRLGRTFLETLNLVNWLEKRGVQVISLSPGESWSTVQDKSFRQFLISIFSWVAENERNVLRERVKVGIQEAKQNGKQIGRPTKEPDKKTVMKYRKKGLTWAEISRIMQIPTSTMYKYKEKWEQEDRLNRVKNAGDDENEIS
ncbi:recombinase family protein [Methanohalobium evestigatum]|uniref:recombinase family protein n=1 Tax=Methanohalobium evestigatum TaxID=2322 RepID=UPI0022B3D200|nr:recombinase family protein [Methanohalobium evestigatum]